MSSVIGSAGGPSGGGFGSVGGRQRGLLAQCTLRVCIIFHKQFPPWANWDAWDELIAANGISIDRPRGSAHPVHSEIIYPIDYGYVNDTVGEDGDEVDIFVGTAEVGLVGAMVTVDHGKRDVELKLLWNCSPTEIYVANGFINFDQTLMEGRLVMRQPLIGLWTGRAP